MVRVLTVLVSLSLSPWLAGSRPCTRTLLSVPLLIRLHQNPTLTALFCLFRGLVSKSIPVLTYWGSGLQRVIVEGIPGASPPRAGLVEL